LQIGTLPSSALDKVENEKDHDCNDKQPPRVLALPFLFSPTHGKILRLNITEMCIEEILKLIRQACATCVFLTEPRAEDQALRRPSSAAA
jgi:hypothetical protein